jgi:sterol desaturase/sphingolipid hydroxylase (fatty acid hydroxylase superfamily)
MAGGRNPARANNGGAAARGSCSTVEMIERPTAASLGLCWQGSIMEPEHLMGIESPAMASRRSAAVRDWFLRNRPFLVFPAVIVGLVWWAVAKGEHGLGILAGTLAAGFGGWTLLEWGLHRAMHIPTRSPRIRGWQELLHLRHHREPDDLEHSVVRLSVSIPLTLVFLGTAHLALGDSTLAAMVVSGLLSGYVVYEFVHLAAHASWSVPGLGYLRRYHSRHHFEQWNLGFGVTSPVWDWAFGTLPRSNAGRDLSRQ